MKFLYKLQFVLLFSLFVSTINAQSPIDRLGGNYKIGASILTNYSSDYQAFTSNKGVDVGVELPLVYRLSFNLTASAHFGSYDFRLSETSPESTDIIAGLHPELRYYLKDKLKGSYIGAGFEYKRLRIINYFEPTPDDLQPTLIDTEMNVGISAGYNWTIKNRITLNPYAYVGFDPIGNNEYPVNARMGVAIGWLN